MRLRKNSFFQALRGGSFNYGLWDLSGSARNRLAPVVRFKNVGFRFVVRGKP